MTSPSEGPVCPGCGRDGILQPATIVYGERAVDWKPVWTCRAYPTCDHYVGCHAKGHKPLGTMAGPGLRAARREAHAVFDPLWKGDDAPFSRSDAYYMMLKWMGLPWKESHIACFDVGQCRQVVKLVRAHQLRRIVYHGCSRQSAKSLQTEGICIEASVGGYYGRAFYAAWELALAKSNYADWAEAQEGEKGTVLAYGIRTGSRILNLDAGHDPDWTIWKESGLSDRISSDRIAEMARRAGIDGVIDTNAIGGVAVYNPEALCLLTTAYEETPNGGEKGGGV